MWVIIRKRRLHHLSCPHWVCTVTLVKPCTIHVKWNQMMLLKLLHGYKYLFISSILTLALKNCFISYIVLYTNIFHNDISLSLYPIILITFKTITKYISYLQSSKMSCVMLYKILLDLTSPLKADLLYSLHRHITKLFQTSHPLTTLQMFTTPPKLIWNILIEVNYR